MEPARPRREAVFVENVVARRKRDGLTQTDLARAMKERGFAFHQQTVQRIEDGARPVRLDEAYALAEILGGSVDMMSVSLQGIGRYQIGALLEGLFPMGGDNFFPGSGGAHDFLRTAEAWLEQDPGSSGGLAAVELLRRLLNLHDQIEAQNRTALDDVVEVLVHFKFLPDLSVWGDGDELSEDERRARHLAETVPLPTSLASLSLTELVSAYIESFDGGL